MMKQLFFVLFMATVVLMLSANEAAAANETAPAGNGTVSAGACTTTLATASLMGLAFNVLMNFWQ